MKLDLFDNSTSNLPPVTESEMSDEKVLGEIRQIREKLGSRLLILGHHYQQDDVIRFADVTGDSLKLAQKIRDYPDAEFIIFLGVHFMAETADMLASPHQHIILPDLNAGCSMADMAEINDVREAWNRLTRATKANIVPITYINSAASLKAFVGEHHGSICTSSNAAKVIQWAFSKGEKLLFFPDQHLGRNTCYHMGIPLDQMVMYDPKQPNGGLSDQSISNARVILWKGYCSVHQGFTLKQIETIRKKHPDIIVTVHPECAFEIVQAADHFGSTSQIIQFIKDGPAGAHYAVGTEINLVNRLAREFKDKTIESLSPYQCLCTTMYRIRPRWLLNSLRSIEQGHPEPLVTVDPETTRKSMTALNNMLNIS